MSVIDVGTWGWDQVGWTQDYYPPDLPADWKLSYYANHFETVYVPAQQQTGLSEELVRQWQQEAGERFEFSAECPAAVIGGGQTALEDWLDAWLCLGENLVGVVVDVHCLADPEPALQQLALLAARVPVHLAACTQEQGAAAAAVMELLQQPGIYPVACGTTSTRYRNAQLALIDESEFAQDLRRLNKFIQDFLSQNSDHKILYLYVKPLSGSLAFVEQVQTLIDLITPEAC